MLSLSSSPTVTNGGLPALYPLPQVSSHESSSSVLEYELPVHFLLPSAALCIPTLSIYLQC